MVVDQKIEKVTAFITRETRNGDQLLLLEHPHAGVQIPAGTVNPSETPEQAVLREIFEETGLTISSKPEYLDCQQTKLADDEATILPPATVYARPDLTSFDWINIKSAVQVKVLRRTTGFLQISYIEYDQVPNPNFASMQITGWVQDECLATRRKRYFYHLRFFGETKSRWKTFSDHHTFTLFWAPINDLPAIIPPQNTWLKFLGQIFE
jgi:8-oxo-dGTP pyrophosphatase MutT (NUDIX family)